MIKSGQTTLTDKPGFIGLESSGQAEQSEPNSQAGLACPHAGQSDKPDKWLAERDIKARQKQAIRSAFARGELVCRRVNEARAMVDSKELEYQRDLPNPRPGTLIQEGLRIAPFGRGFHLGLASVKTLYAYKKDIHSSACQSKGKPRRWLHPDKASLLDKLTERDNRLDSLYRPCTSGRLGVSGRHISGCLKTVSRVASSEVLDSNEIIIQHYRTDNYRCIFVFEPLSFKKLFTILQDKITLEQNLSIPELPLVLYDPCRGCIGEIVFPSDYGIDADSLPVLSSQIASMQSLIERAGCFNLEEVICLLPLSRVLHFLRTPSAGLVEAQQQFSTPFRQQLRAAVERADLDAVIWYCQQGASLTALYPDSRGQLCSLLELLLDSSSVSTWAPDIQRRDPERLRSLTHLGKVLVDGSRRVMINDAVLRSLPSLAAYMVGRESCEWSPDICWQEVVYLLIFNVAEKTITRDEFETLVRAVQRQFRLHPNDLDRVYTEAVSRHLFHMTDLPDFYEPSHQKLAEDTEATVRSFTSLGIIADLATLNQNLQTRRARENELLDTAKAKDKLQLSYIKEEVDRAPHSFEPDSKDSDVKVSSREARLAKFARHCMQSLDSWMYDAPLDYQTALNIARHLIEDDLTAAEDVIEQRYQTMYQRLEDKYQVLSALFQSMATIQEKTERGQLPAETEASAPLPKEGDQEPESQDAFAWLRRLYDFAPETSGKSYRQLAQTAINHYYLMPHPGQAVRLIHNRVIPELFKPDHGPDHVTRTQLLAEALLELFARHDPEFSKQLAEQPELRELAPLAMVYHDVTAEVEAKAVEEIRAAEFFTRDMNAAGCYSSAAISLVASALRNKESDVLRTIAAPLTADADCGPLERNIRRILRLADRLDVVRMTHIPQDWQQAGPARSADTFNSRYLDLPDTLTAEFTREFKALMEGAKDLAWVTGGMPRSDHSPSGPYWQRYQLQGDNYKRKRKVARAVNAYDSVRVALDDNVRRKIAAAAGIRTCLADHSVRRLLNNGQASCVEIRDDHNIPGWLNGCIGALCCGIQLQPVGAACAAESLSAIHSEIELRQVVLPEAMTILQKLMFEQLGTAGLPAQSRAAVLAEIHRLRREGIRPPLGTLTQAVLASPEARATLRQRYHLEVVSEKRFSGYSSNGRPCYQSCFTTRPGLY